MAGHKLNVIPEREQLFSYRVNELVVVAFWEVGAPDRARKNDITHPGELLSTVKKTTCPGV